MKAFVRYPCMKNTQGDARGCRGEKKTREMRCMCRCTYVHHKDGTIDILIPVAHQNFSIRYPNIIRHPGRKCSDRLENITWYEHKAVLVFPLFVECYQAQPDVKNINPNILYGFLFLFVLCTFYWCQASYLFRVFEEVCNALVARARLLCCFEKKR